MLPYPHLPGHYTTLRHCHSHNPCYNCDYQCTWEIQWHPEPQDHQSPWAPLFDSTDTALFAGVDDDDDDNTSLTGVPIPIATNDDDDDSDTESDHNSIDPNEADDNSIKASIHSTQSQAPIHSMTSEIPQLPPFEEELDDTQLPQLETQVPILHQSKRVSVPLSDYIPQTGGKTYAMN